MDLGDPTTAVLLAAEAFERAGLPYAVYGGLLLAAYGEPRETHDADLAVIHATAASAAEALRNVGAESRLVFERTRFGGLTVDRLTLLGAKADRGLCALDLVRPMSARYREEAVRRATTAPMRDRTVRVLVPEDYVLFKVLSTRARDLEDAASVLHRWGDDLDRKAIRREVETLAVEIPDFDIRARLSELERLARSGPLPGPEAGAGG